MTIADHQMNAEECFKLIRSLDIDQIRLAWCDVHGTTRVKTLTLEGLKSALHSGIGMVSTLFLKDTSDRTAYKVFESGGTDSLPGFGQGNNVFLKPDYSSLKQLPWSPKTAWLRCQAFFSNGGLVPLDSRSVLQTATEMLAKSHMQLMCGLEIEFHVYRVKSQQTNLDPSLAQWPGRPLDLELIHPGYNLLSEVWSDMVHEPFRIIQDTTMGLGLPLTSLEVEFGPSQVEAVFSVTDALTAADNMVLFRNAIRQALWRNGYYASFVCRPPFQQIMSSGWHLHQSLWDSTNSKNLFAKQEVSNIFPNGHAQETLSEIGEQYLAGLLAHAKGTSVFCTPTTNGYERYAPNALAPQSIVWGRDNRGAMLRVIGESGESSTRIENRQGEPAANPYLYMASQIYAGMDGIERKLTAPKATDSPYQNRNEKLPNNLKDALSALHADTYLVERMGHDFINYISTLKSAELQRYEAATDKVAFHASEYFSRI